MLVSICIYFGGNMERELTPEERRAVEIFEGFASYDIIELFMEADVEIPRGETFYNPIYEEEWG
jgi:hypothetical protein